MKNDIRERWPWTARLPNGRRVRLDVAEGVRLCVGDVVWIGGALYSVVKRQLDGGKAGWNVVVRKGSEEAAPHGKVRRPRLVT